MFQRQVDGHDECAGRDAGDDDQQRRGGQRHREVGQQGDILYYYIFLYHVLLFAVSQVAEIRKISGAGVHISTEDEVTPAGERVVTMSGSPVSSWFI